MGEVLRIIDADICSGLNLEQFNSLARTPTNVEQWAHGLPIADILGDAVVGMTKFYSDPLGAVSQLTVSDIGIICEGLVDGLKRLMEEHCKLLKDSKSMMDFKAAHPSADRSLKFDVVKMSCGTVMDLHSGIEGRTGLPHLQFDIGMETEHCSKPCCDVEFTTPHDKVTTPKQEWKYVVECVPCPDVGRRRMIPEIKQLQQLQSVRDAALSRAEVIAVVLYTGPMEVYSVYSKGGNTFSTTIYVLVSAVQKLSRTAPLPEGLVLYRGLGGALDLPDSFFRGDERGCKGYAEWGFMSTTSDKEVALRYSSVKEGRPCPTVLVMRVGAVDCGACIRELSQYAAEVEYLWLPCSWLEPRGRAYLEVAPEGIVRMMPCDARANLRAATTDELVGRRKRAHLAAFRFHLDYLRPRLEEIARDRRANDRLLRDPTRNKDKEGKRADTQQWTVEGYLDRIMAQCYEVVAAHTAVTESHYAEEGRFWWMVVGMVDTLHMAHSKLLHWLDDPSSYIAFFHGGALRTVHRQRIAYLGRMLAREADAEARRGRALELCRVKGLVETGLDEANELGESRLIAAAAEGRSPADVRLLVAAAADVNRADKEGFTALHSAAAAGHVDLVRTLAALKADLNVSDPTWSRTAAYLAATSGQAECVEALAEARADVCRPNKIGTTPVLIAAHHGRCECIASLVQARAEVDTPDEDGMTPLYVAASNGHAECVRLLAAARADVNTPKRPGGITPVWYAAQEGHVECIRVLKEFGADVTRVCDGRTPLEQAERKGHGACVEELKQF